MWSTSYFLYFATNQNVDSKEYCSCLFKQDSMITNQSENFCQVCEYNLIIVCDFEKN